MTCGYWLRLNGVWTPIEGVQAGVGVESERGGSSFTSVGGVRHTQAARRRARTWQVPLGHAGPQAVAALMVAAQGDGGDVMLWDESAARANLLDPVATRGREGYPIVDCGGIGLVSLTRGPTAGTVVRTVALKENVTFDQSINAFPGRTIGVTPGTVEALVKVAVPLAPEGTSLSTASLVLARTSASSGTLTAYEASSAWVEGYGPSLWNTIPAGASRGSATIGDQTSVSLTGVGGYAGSDMSLRLVKTSGSGGSSFYGRDHATAAPYLRLTYAVGGRDTIARQYLRAGNYYLTCWTDAPAGATLGSIASGASLPIVVPADSGSGLRRVTIDLSAITSTADREYVITLADSSSYILAGLMLSSVAPSSYLPPSKTPVRVHVQDPTLTLQSLYAGEHGKGDRAVTISEVGA